LTINEWADLTVAFKRMLKHLPQHSTNAGGYYADKPLVIRGSNGKGRPEISQDFICFNGNWCPGENLGHEAFVLARCGEGFQFCKTERKPYDLLVCAVLLCVTEIAPGAFSIASDGDMRGEEWRPAREFLIGLARLETPSDRKRSQQHSLISLLAH
jgi:hypothetical protein